MGEQCEQVALARWLDAMGLIWCHPPNGGHRSRITGAKLKAAGVKPGVPDVLIFGPTEHLPEGCSGLAIELKRRRSPTGRKLGHVSSEQRAWLEMLERCGWRTTVAHGFAEAVEWLASQGVSPVAAGVRRG